MDKNKANIAGGGLSLTKLTNGGVVQLHDLINFLYKACKSQTKGMFASFLSSLTL
jgi:hypothetical protein